MGEQGAHLSSFLPTGVADGLAPKELALRTRGFLASDSPPGPCRPHLVPPLAGNASRRLGWTWVCLGAHPSEFRGAFHPPSSSRAKATNQSRAAGLASESRLAARSGGVPVRILFTGTSRIFPDRVRGTSAMA